MYLSQKTEPQRINIALLEATFVRALQHHRQELDWIDYKKIDGERYNIYQQNDGDYIGCFIFFPIDSDVTEITYQYSEEFDELFQKIMTKLDNWLGYNKQIADEVRASSRFFPLSTPTGATKSEPPPAPATQITNVNINVQGNTGDIIVGDDNSIEH